MAKILVVDDEPYIVDLMKRFLGKKGHEVISESDGNQVISRIDAESPEVVLLDLNLPGRSGLEILEEIGTKHKDLAVIMITGVRDDSVGRLALEMGAFDYITKPIDFDYLETVLWVKLQLLLSDDEEGPQ